MFGATSRSAALGKVVALSSDAELISRFWLMLVVFLVSLFAVSFPTLSKRIRYLRIPSIVFFIGKHFGTGVILSTAFVHLLQDAFEALRRPEVRERSKVGNWVGLIVLGSLLSIFCVEYISTSYVDRLHSYSSEPPTPSSASPTSSPTIVPVQVAAPQDIPPLADAHPRDDVAPSPKGTSREWQGVTRESAPGLPAPPLDHTDATDPTGHPGGAPLPLAPPERTEDVRNPPSSHDEGAHNAMTERTPLAGPAVTQPTRETQPRPLHLRPSYGTTRASQLVSASAERPAFRRTYPHTLPRGVSAPAIAPALAPAPAAPLDVAEDIFSGGHHRHEERAMHASHHSVGRGWKGWFGLSEEEQKMLREVVGDDAVGDADGGEDGQKGSRRVSVHVHGHGREHAEGHGHRHAHDQGHAHGHGQGGGGGHGHTHIDIEQWNGYDSEAEVEVDESDPAVKVGRRRQIVGILMLQLGIMMHSLVIGLTLAIASGPEFTSLVAAINFHQLFEGLSLGIRIAGLPTSSAHSGIGRISGRMLKPTLAVAFAMTVPVGIAIGLGAFGVGRSQGGAGLQLIQGLMSAISAGMLIYAACVEMLAGDFVMDPHLWRSTISRQILAIVSLFAGVAAMAAIG
ncbi:Zinc/iron permease [Obba rivulosa]|uniref:Zinc/iron permease n=1 Tax=Obba rivulosa TaxID=1052685 RepID=A0A8E2DLH3_9APHY|nr:Zinc/iron permease [Obba rivulosa]